MYRISGGNPLFLRALHDADDNALAKPADGGPGAARHRGARLAGRPMES
ncbi:hypothetical protein ACIHFD_48070 [Nonomuraea sp. NPDC051941]